MAIQGFIIGEVELGGPHPGQIPACGLTAENVEVHIGEEEFFTLNPSSDEVTYRAQCSAKVGSLACQVCKLSELGDMTDFEVGFDVMRRGANTYSIQPTLLRAVKRALPRKLATDLDCDKENGATR